METSYRILGVRVNALTIPDLHRIIADAVSTGRKRIVASQNLHGVYVARVDSQMREFYDRADYVRIDGMPLAIWAGFLGYPINRNHRVTWVDWLRPLLEESAKRQWRVFYLGSKPGVAEVGAERLCAEVPGVEIATAHGYFDSRPDSDENRQLIEKINAYRPHVLMVGMGMPRQEKWILENWESVEANVFLPCGACIDYFAGVIPAPPRWMGRLGLEWLARLLSEPRRLWRRYLVEPWFVADLFVRDLTTLVVGRRHK